MRIRILAVASLLALACGGSPSPEPSTPSAREASVEAEVPPPSAGPMTLDAPPDVAAPPPAAERTASGLASRVIVPGDGDANPGPRDHVTVHYVGWHTDGERFDSSLERGEPATFPLDRVIDGWTEAVQLMVVGERRRLWIPEALAYRGRPGAPQGMLVFDVELLAIEPAPEPPSTPDDLTAPPPDAERHASGLVSRVLRAGSGDRRPGPTDTAVLHYSGWRAETGELFDSSVTRGRPLEARPDRLIPGFEEGLEQMVVGERRRLWIPARLAYEGRPSGPQGDLVFDVELLEIR